MLEAAPKMPADVARMQAGKATDLRPKVGGKLRLHSLADLDGRTVASRRARSLAAALAEELGGIITASLGAAIERAATLVALAEDVRSRRLAGDESVSLEDLVRVDAAADRAVRRLHLAPGASRSSEPDLATYLAGLAAEDAAAAENAPPDSETPAEAENDASVRSKAIE